MKARVIVLVTTLLLLLITGQECATAPAPQVVEKAPAVERLASKTVTTEPGVVEEQIAEQPVVVEEAVTPTPESETPKPIRLSVSSEIVETVAGYFPQEPPYPVPIIAVPEAAIQKMNEIAQWLADSGLVLGPAVPFNATRATSYALPSLGGDDGGLLLMAAPLQEALENELENLSEQPGLALGGFHIPQGIADYDLPPGQYVARVFFADGQPQADLYDEGLQRVQDAPTVVRRLQHREVTQPEVAITAREICFTQRTLQACIQLPPPLPSEAVDRVKQAVTELTGAGLLGVDVDAEGTVPDIEGVNARTRCAQTVSQEPQSCRSSVLAAPAVEFQTQPIEGDPTIMAKATAGVLVVLEPIDDEVWSAETGALATLSPGNYIVDFLETFDGRWLALLTSPEAGVGELSSPADFSQDAVFIDFDELANGSHVTTQYADEGVVFIDVKDTSHRITQAPPSFSLPNQLYHYRGGDDENRRLPLTMVFGEPQAKIGFYFSNAAETAATLTAYDASDQVIHQLTRMPSGDEWQFWGIYSGAGDITAVTLDYGDSYLAEAIDDLYFDFNVGLAQFLMIAESQPERTEVLGELQGESPTDPEGQVVIKNLNWDFVIKFCLFRSVECPPPQ